MARDANRSGSTDLVYLLACKDALECMALGYAEQDFLMQQAPREGLAVRAWAEALVLEKRFDSVYEALRHLELEIDQLS